MARDVEQESLYLYDQARPYAISRPDSARAWAYNFLPMPDPFCEQVGNSFLTSLFKPALPPLYLIEGGVGRERGNLVAVILGRPQSSGEVHMKWLNSYFSSAVDS
ncbi:hypothetical protein CRG98_023571 [Punica granatum]|uniref:Uncharacterized protein n=1 Tax=Punica granatum TaxID=22663 RepID=A0A2I0JIG8_PUNGR|nr:hypothetical protein CRG98_023571 [Punica granatum]